MSDLFNKSGRIILAIIYLTHVLCATSMAQNQNLLSHQENSQLEEAETVLDPIFDPELKNYFIKMEDFANRLENSFTNSQDTPSRSVFGLQGQSIEFLDGRLNSQYSLDRGQLEIVKPAFTLLSYSSNSSAKEFIIEAISGADDKGKNGKIVARHILKGYDVATVVADNLLVIIVEKNGNISVIPKSLIVHYGFEAPIPVFKSINGTPLKFNLANNNTDFHNNGYKVKGEFLTIGLKPIQSSETNMKLNSETEYEAGQLAIWEENEKGERANLKLLPMTTVLEFVNLGLRYLNAATQLVSLDHKNVKDLELILKDIHESQNEELFNKVQSVLTPEESEILSKFSADKIIKTLSGAEQLRAANLSPRDKFTLAEWEKEYSELQKNAEEQYAINLAQAEKEKEKNKSLMRKIFFFLKKNQVVDPEDYKPNAKNYQNFLTKVGSPLKFKKEKVNIFKENLNKILKSKAVTFMMIGAPVLAFYSLPYFYDKSETLKQIESLSFLYENIMPEVLKDHAYRTPLIISTVIQIAIIPLVYLSAWAFKNTVLGLAYTYKSSNTPFALRVKDFATRYKEITTSQVLLTLNVRFFSMIVTPYWKNIIEGLLGQRTFFNAAKKGLNPFKRISKDSELGKELGLEKSTFVGLGLPLPFGLNQKAENQHEQTHNYLAKAQQAKEVNLRVQEILSSQKRSLEMTAWLLATKAISEKHEIDPASLYMGIELKQVTSLEVTKILSNPELKKKWEILSDELIHEFKKLDTFSLSLLKEGISKEQFAELYQKAKSTAEKLDKMSSVKQTLKSRYLTFKKSLQMFKSWSLNLGEKESKFLKQVIPGKYVTQQVNQDFPVDQLMVSGISGVFGDMANLKKPEYLMADASKMLYTSDAQLYSVSTNIYGHLVASASTLSLMFDQIRDQEETRYTPRENMKIQNNEWSPSFLDSTKSWAGFAFNPLKSDVGGLAVKRYLTRMNTIFASITFNLVTRVMISSQGIGVAWTSFVVGFLRGHMAFGWPWDFIQAGNSQISNDAEKNLSKLKNIQYKLSQGIRERNDAKSQMLIDEAYSETLEYYIKHNPQAIQDLKQTILSMHTDIVIQNAMSKIDIKDLSKESLKYIGLFSQFIVAQKNQDDIEVDKIKNSLVKLYSDNSAINLIEIKKLDAKGLLALTQAAPPIPTRENATVTWVTSILFGAIFTTVLYTYLAPLLMDPVYLSQPNVIWDALKTSVLFTGIYYLLLGKKPWEFYLKSFNKAKGYLSKVKSEKIFEFKKLQPRNQSCLRYY